MGKKIEGSEPRELIPARTYLAVIVGVYDIGTQASDYGPKAQWVLEYELHTRKGPARGKDDNVLTICQFVSAYLGNKLKPSVLLKVVQAAKGHTFGDAEIKAGFDIEDLVEATVKVQITHKAKGDGSMRANVESVSALDEDDEKPTVVSDARYFEIKPGSDKLPDWLPKFVGEYAKKSEELKGGGKVPAVSANGKPVRDREPGDDDDDIPY